MSDIPTTLEFLQAIYCNEAVPLPDRMRAAVEAAPYVHATYKATALIVDDGSFAARLDRARLRSGVDTSKVIEHKPDNRA